MGRLGRILVILVGMACSVAAGVIAMPALAIMNPVTREAGFTLFTTTILALMDSAIEPEDAAASFLLLAHGVTLAICFAPLAVATLLGELAGVRSWFWYACCCGFLAAAMPFLLRLWTGLERRTMAPDSTTATAENHFLLLFFFVGLITGSIYWLIAGRNAGAASTKLEGTTA